MKRNPTPRAARLATKTAELMLAAPQVVAHRVGRMAQAGHVLSAQDRREFSRMGSEKVAAFQESWAAMGQQAWRQQAQLAQVWMGLWTAWLRAASRPWHPTGWLVGTQAIGRSASQLQQVALGMADKGLEPVHRRAVANARRLSSSPGPRAASTAKRR
jgi:hypothetical protein